jgi:SSS family solute:Na+ symporter
LAGGILDARMVLTIIEAVRDGDMPRAQMIAVLQVTSHRFGGFDLAIVVFCALLLLGTGLFFARRQKNADVYFVAGRNRSPLLAGVSLFAALFTLIAYIGIPGEVVQHGPVLVLGSLAALPFSYFVISRHLIPAFMRLPITSGYELLETRLGRPVRVTASITFICVRIVWMSLLIYAASKVLVSVTGCEPKWLPLIAAGIGLIATLYTLAGGIEAVMTTAVLQFALLLLGAILTVSLITLYAGGFDAGWLRQAPEHWMAQPFFSADPTVRLTVVGTFVSYFISTICAGGSDQVAIQRYLTTRDAAAARKAVMFGHLSIGAVMLSLGIVGAALLGYFAAHPELLPPGKTLAQAGDGLFPYFLGHGLPPGISGLVVAGLLTSAVSGVAPGINSIIAVLNQEVIEPLVRQGRAAEGSKVRIARLLSLVIGGLITLGSLAMSQVSGNLVEVSGKTINVFFYPMFSLFFLALFVRFANATGAIFGAIYGLTTAIVVGYWDTLTGMPRVSFQWIGPSSLFVSLTAGCLFSLMPLKNRSPAFVWTFRVAALGVLAFAVSRVAALHP